MAGIYKTNAGWRAQVRRAGLPSLSGYFASKAEAQRWARAQEHKIDQGERIPAALRVTVAEVIDAYLGATKRRKWGRNKLWVLDRLKQGLGHYRLAEVTKQVVLDYATRRENEGAGPPSLAQHTAYLRTAIRYGATLLDAEDAGMALVGRLTGARDTLSHAGRLRRGQKRKRRLHPGELDKLIHAASLRRRGAAPIADMVKFAIATCMRRGEVVRIAWEDVDLEARTVVVRMRKHPTQKEFNDQVVPLLAGHFTRHGAVVDPVDIMLRQPSAKLRRGRVFPYSGETVNSAFDSICASAGVTGLTFHDLRHEGISLMFDAGYDIPRVAVVSGHTTWESLKTYAQLDPRKVQM